MASASRAVCLLLMSLALLQCVQGQISAQQIVQALKETTTLSDNLRVETQKIDTANAAILGSRIARPGSYVIIGRIEQANSMLQGSQSSGGLIDADARLVLNALTTFVEAQQMLLKVVIAKHSVLTMVLYFESIRVALKRLENSEYVFAIVLTAQIPTQTSAAKAKFDSLSGAVAMAIKTYS